tara:strand:+ start:13044 stop:13448 length:405 start_codon:yes stop_codon:yes gene_type:complete
MSESVPSSPAILGVGVDLIEIDRIHKAWERHGQQFLERILTQEERDYCMSKTHSAPSIAARFAAKEAASKALGTGIGKDLEWHSVAIHKGPRDEPIAVLDEKAQRLIEKCGGKKLLISLTHTKTLAQAVAIIST